MTYNFDKPIDRRGTGDLKHEALGEMFGKEDLLPLWVADMDWATPPFVVNAIKERLEHPILGYTVMPKGYWKVVSRWIWEHHQWKVSEEWMTYVPGIVKAIGMVVNVFVGKDEKVIVQPPIYHPFHLVPGWNGRGVVWNPLKEVLDEQGNVVSYEMDFENLEQVCDSKCRLLVLANPHNPAGIVWSRDTLRRLAQFAKSHGLIVISDEIHCDMALWGCKHVPFASVSSEAAEVSITFGAPTKTFNMAGVVSSWCIIPNAQLREKFFGWLEANELNAPNMFAPLATMAALQQGEEWRKQMLAYVESNVSYLLEYCKTHIPQVKPVRPQASYLVWLDCRDLGLTSCQLNDFFVHKVGVALNEGSTFGSGGEGFMRLNAGTQRCVLAEALARLEAAVQTLLA